MLESDAFPQRTFISPEAASHRFVDDDDRARIGAIVRRSEFTALQEPNSQRLKIAG
jgi:hypothetical protein